MQQSGLSSYQAQKLRQEHGPNRLVSGKKSSLAAMFFSQFKDLMILILAVATVISVLMGEGVEAITIIAIVLMNAVMGFLQEYKTEKTLTALQEMTAPVARVLRDEQSVEIPASEVVPRDIALLKAGDRIPADGEIAECSNFTVDEALLTGESAAVTKKAGDRVFMGTTVANGTGVFCVSAIGMKTEMGRIAGMLDQTKPEKTPLQEKLTQLGKTVAVACIVICVAVSLLGWLRGAPFLDMLLTGVSLAVAAVPEGLPAIVTIVLALSVGRILKKGAIIRKLPAVETLGCAGVICSDKTGTITQNRMTVRSIYSGGREYAVDGDGCRRNGSFRFGQTRFDTRDDTVLTRLLRCAVLCNNAVLREGKKEYELQGDATETALLVAAARGGVTNEKLVREYRRIFENPFDSNRKRMSVTVQGHREKTLLCKGAPDLLLACCNRIAMAGGDRPLTAQDRRHLSNCCREYAEQAYRVLAFAESGSPEAGETNLIFLGLAAMQDPPKPQVESAVRRCRRAGMKPVMITGDYRETAAAVAAQVGICQPGDLIVTGSELEEMSDERLKNVCMKISVFARVTPQHKLRIVKAYQASGQVVAMTGDGVNDAPAVRQADIGVAMNSGTDVTKEAGDVVILDDNFATIVSAVEEGRIIYQNIRRFIQYLLTGNLGEVLSMLFSMLLGLPMPLVPIQILMVNLLTDGLPAIALGMEPPDEKIMQQPPRPRDESLFAHGLMRMILVRGVFLGLATAGVYFAVCRLGGDMTVARSTAYLTLVLSQMVYIFECRGKVLDFRGNPVLLAAAGASVLITLLCIYIPVVQGIFRTTAVTGIYLLLALVGIFIGPVGTAILRWIRHFFI